MAVMMDIALAVQMVAKMVEKMVSPLVVLLVVLSVVLMDDSAAVTWAALMVAQRGREKADSMVVERADSMADLTAARLAAL